MTGANHRAKQQSVSSMQLRPDRFRYMSMASHRMRLCAAGLAAAALCLGTAGRATGQAQPGSVPTTVTVPAEARFAVIRSGLVERIASGEIPSAAVAVIENGRIVWAEALGWADLETRRPATPETSYLLGSLAKALTSAVVMGLVEDGRLGLDDSIDPWVSVRNFGGGSGYATLRQLLDATAGIPHGWRSFTAAGLAPTADEDWDEWLASDIFLAFPPGVVFEYSNNSFGVAARVAERATGTPFEALIAERLFRPLGMASSFARCEAVPPNAIAVPYATGADGFEAQAGEAAPEAGLGMYASVSDLARFGTSMLGLRLPDQRAALGPATLSQFRQSASGPGRPFFHFGFWNTGRSYIANGNVTGANAHLALAPSDAVVVAVTVNATGFAADEVADQIVTLLAGPESSNNPNSRAAYEAQYRTPLWPDAALTGRWAGSVDTTRGAVPITIDISSAAVTVRVGADDAVMLVSPSFNVFRELRGTLLTPPPALGADLDSVAVTLRHEGNRLDGYILLRGSDAVPYPAQLHAEAGPPAQPPAIPAAP